MGRNYPSPISLPSSRHANKTDSFNSLSLSLSLSLSRHTFLSAIPLDKSSRRHPVPQQKSWMEIFSHQPALIYPCRRVYKIMWLINWFLLHQLYPAYLVRLTGIVWELDVIGRTAIIL